MTLNFEFRNNEEREMYFTEKQLRIMEFIQQFREERGISPTLDEIASNFGVTKITVY